ncbi:MAG: ABC transporter permease [Candidatus Aminicenantes bacterium]|nr:ABC transporter permease [Candidatus Aminicenantes bacterium]MBL7083810.1 ABC transporter permease [Candidatus Aminicenantes bacterium]
MLIVFFLEKDLSETKRSLIEENLKKSSLLKDAQFVSSEQALEKFQQNFPELQGIIDNININPFPSSFETTLRDENISSVKILVFIQEISRLEGIEDVQFNKDWVEKMESLSRLAKAAGFFLGGILILASFFIISNVIRLNVFARKDEIEIFRLVGATNIFIRIPFLMEGMILGVLGALISLVFLFLLVKFFPLYLGTSLGALNELINFRYLSIIQIFLFIAAGIIIGLLGSISSIARFLKV